MHLQLCLDCRYLTFFQSFNHRVGVKKLLSAQNEGGKGRYIYIMHVDVHDNMYQRCYLASWITSIQNRYDISQAYDFFFALFLAKLVMFFFLFFPYKTTLKERNRGKREKYVKKIRANCEGRLVLLGNSLAEIFSLNFVSTDIV